jgi:hypothetical protein
LAYLSPGDRAGGQDGFAADCPRHAINPERFSMLRCEINTATTTLHRYIDT